MVDIAVHKWDEEDLETVLIDEAGAVQAEFLRDVAVALFKVKDLTAAQQAGSPFSARCGCLYHEHGAKKPCYKTMFIKSSDTSPCGLKGLGKTSSLG
jgi:hypothetical protein